MAKWITTCEWEDVPHLSEEMKRDMLDSYLPHEIEAREKGIPTVGAGKIYPIEESRFVVDPFQIPPHWPKVYGMDVGWTCTACVWGAYDEKEDTIYLYREYKSKLETPTYHNAIIRKYTGDWMLGVIDPAAKSLKMKKDGVSFLKEYRDMGLEVYLANNSVDVGLMNVSNRLTTGRLKVFSSCSAWLNEFRIYRRKNDTTVLKQNDDLMDATRYLCMSGLPYAQIKPEEDDDGGESERALRRSMRNRGVNPITGY